MVELDKPLLVMRKRPVTEATDSTKTATHYQVECLIKRKLLFHKRSKPIVQYAAKKL